MENIQICTASAADPQAAASIDSVLERIDNGRGTRSEGERTRTTIGPYASGSEIHGRKERTAMQRMHHVPFVCSRVPGRSPEVGP